MTRLWNYNEELVACRLCRTADERMGTNAFVPILLIGDGRVSISGTVVNQFWLWIWTASTTSVSLLIEPVTEALMTPFLFVLPSSAARTLALPA